MKCGACGAPIANGLIRCPFCGASVKYAITESGTLPYEYVPGATPRRERRPPKPPSPRWDLEQPEGTSYSYYKAMRTTFERWADLERRRRVGRGRLGCVLTGVIFGVFVVSCSLFSLASSQARLQGLTGTPSTSDLTATATANPDPYIAHGLLTLNNHLNENSNANWMNYGSDSRPVNQGCIFQDGSYDTSKPAQRAPSIRYCLANATSFRNFTYQIEMQNVQGQSGGIVFRANEPGNFYYFYIDTNGSYALWLNTGAGIQGKILTRGASRAIGQGNDRLNILAVVADGVSIELYANYTLLATVHDGTYSSGRIGTAVGAPDEMATEYLFNNAKVWTW